ncbi:MAG TPA: hypothetical protein VFO85_20350, partial [Vicinamibacteria bacterium]|nr:hypothetical protein [Vicinamibacteria bacterium]
MVFDEPYILVGAERVLRGEVPFRDFYALYPPGQYFAVAGLFGLFGVKAQVLRLYCVAVRALIGALLYDAARQAAGRAAAAICWLLATLWLVWTEFYGYPMFAALALVLVAFALLRFDVDAARRPRARIFAAGVALGLAGLFRHDLAFYGLVAAAPLLWVLLPRRAAAGGRRAWADAARTSWPFLAGVAAAFGIPFLVLLAVAPWREMFFELVVYPSMIYPLVRRVGYRPLLPAALGDVLVQPKLLLVTLVNLPWYVPVAVDAAALAAVGARMWRRRPAGLGIREATVAGLALLSLFAFNAGRVRPDAVHMLAMILPSYAVAAALVAYAWRRKDAAARAAGAAGAAACLLTAVQPVLEFPDGSLACLRKSCAGRQEAARAFDVQADPSIREAADYLRAAVPPGQRIFVGCGRHDMVVINEPVLYFLSERA